jgi:hypothetical protein
MRFGYTNVTATLALFVALSGSSYAAATLTGANVKNGSVSGADIRNGSVKGRDVGGITGGDVKAGALTSADVGVLAGADLGPGQLAAGPQGPAGPAGTTQVLARRVATVTLDEGDEKDVTVTCLAGEAAVGGGAAHDGAPTDLVAVVYSHPLEADGSTPEDGDQATAWRVGAQNLFVSGVDRTLTVYVLCANA